jgi:hypothetical protein
MRCIGKCSQEKAKCVDPSEKFAAPLRVEHIEMMMRHCCDNTTHTTHSRSQNSDEEDSLSPTSRISSVRLSRPAPL